MAENNEIPIDARTLAGCGVLDPEQALKNLVLLRGRIGADAFDGFLPGLLAALRSAADPDMALNHLERFADGISEPAGFVHACASATFLRHLVAILGASRFLSAFLLSDPAAGMTLLTDPSFILAPGREALDRSLAAMTSGDQEERSFFRSLRVFRKREMLRIALRDLTGRAELADTVQELSGMAEVCIARALAWADADLRRRHGRPIEVRTDGEADAGFAVIAMGKLGGGELNFSSDVDLMYVYSAEGETEGAAGRDGAPANRISNHQYFVKLAEKVGAAIGRNTEDGFVFRVDLRLRPEGQRGPIAQSLGGYEIYYESWGQTWERSALIKARPVAGDEDAGREFLVRITPFVYRKYLDFNAIAEIRDMKVRINREVQLKGRSQRDVKLGYGGIREIEFTVQALQLIYGGRDRGVRERGTMKALHVLAQKGLLTYQESGDLTKAYVFLRTVEHRLQMLNDLQTQTLPSGAAELRTLARRCGYREPGREAELLLRDHAMHTRKVRTIYDELLSQTGDAPGGEGQGSDDVAVLLDPASAEQDAAAVLARGGFRDPARAFRNISLLREGQAFVHQTPRGRRVFHELFPLLFREVTASPDPDMALHHLESFLAVQGSWDAFRALVQQDPRVPRALVSVFGNSEYFSRMLVRSPELIDELLDAIGERGLGSARAFERGLEEALGRAQGFGERLDALRRYKHREELRIGMADLTGAVPLRAVSRSLSRLAEACLNAALDLAAAETGRRCGIDGSCRGLAVIGAGKLGGRELIYGSDLDILFVYDESRAGQPPPGVSVFEHLNRVAERTLSCLTAMTREGAAYRVDTRLRPTGSKGPLVQSVEAFRSHFSANAETWERQSLVNSRFAAGDRQVGNVLASSLQELIYRDADPAALAADIRAMRKRMQDERGREEGGQINIKQGPGGLVDIEFVVQYLALRHGRERPRVRVPGTVNALAALRREGLLTAADEDSLCRSYLFYRKLESRLRIVANQSTSVLSRDAGKLRPLARRMGYADGDGNAGRLLHADLDAMRANVRGLYERLLQP